MEELPGHVHIPSLPETINAHIVQHNIRLEAAPLHLIHQRQRALDVPLTGQRPHQSREQRHTHLVPNLLHLPQQLQRALGPSRLRQRADEHRVRRERRAELEPPHDPDRALGVVEAAGADQGGDEVGAGGVGDAVPEDAHLLEDLLQCREVVGEEREDRVVGVGGERVGGGGGGGEEEEGGSEGGALEGAEDGDDGVRGGSRGGGEGGGYGAGEVGCPGRGGGEEAEEIGDEWVGVVRR
uniref:Uncharacterized protein n=1 Tax=Arundo donax TaxID=35708 RepID=A0A0A8ZRM3_ARUDO